MEKAGKVKGITAFKREVNDIHHNHQRHEQSFTDTVARTATEYSRASSLHGIQYIFESQKNLLGSRLLWLVIVISSAAIGKLAN